MTLFKNKYRIESARLQNWDYSTPGWYFVTICTKNHKTMFGQIKNGKMFLNKIGNNVNECWNEIPDHFFNVKLDVFQIMPDHFHGIVVLLPAGENDCVENVPGDEQQRKNKLQFELYDTRIKSPISLSDVIGTFKAAVKRWCNSNDCKYFGWQGRFHDRIIRDANELDRIRKYILQNPTKWENEQNNC